MADANEPMITLERNGTAPVLSYNVPEPTSYSGRNFIDLQLPASYFSPTAVASGSQPASGSPQVPAAAPMREVRTVPSIVPTDPSLARAAATTDAAEATLLPQAGQRLSEYRTMYGTSAFRIVDADVSREPALPAAPAGAQAMASLMDDGGGGGGGGTIPPVRVEITNPARDATLSGPHTGVNVTVQGTAGVTTGTLAKVEVQVGSEPFRPAALATGGAWSLPITITGSGPVTITAKAFKNVLSGTPLTATDTLTVNVSLAPAPDTTPGIVTITSPTNGTTLTGSTTGVAVTVAGTSADPGGGIKTVEAALDQGAFSVVTPRASGDWSSWTKPFTLTPGAHTIKARCTDIAGNLSAVTAVTVTVGVAPPADTTKPAVSILSPVNGATVSGPFSGATIAVRGSAADPSGVRSVELTIDSNPVSVSAQPKGPNDWSEWTASLLVTDPGQHRIAARCTDNAGNVGEASVIVTVSLIPDVVSRLNRLILVENYRLSSYLGSYGAGRTIKTFSLLPGEKTKISVRTFTRRETDAKNASSILDSFTHESATDFETSMSNEQSNKRSYDESFNYRVGGEAQASWGWGSANVSAEVSGGTNAAREEFAKNISNATQKHAAKASAKRDVQINTSYEVKEQSGEETALEREIQNINVGRTLNFVFRQMNQEFITILHLVDVRVGFFRVETVDGQDRYTYREVTLPQLDALLREVIVESQRSPVRNAILHQLTNIFDYQDRHHSFVEETDRKGPDGNVVLNSHYLRAKKDYTSVYRDIATGTEITVPGIILAANRHVLRTEGIIVEALLGAGDALDPYSHGLQTQAIRAQSLNNIRADAEVDRARLAQRIVEQKDGEAADIFAKVYVPAAVTPQP